MDTDYRKALYLTTRITMESDNYLCIDNYKKILTASENFIKLRTVDKIIEVWGFELSLENLSESSIVIEGRIKSLEIS